MSGPQRFRKKPVVVEAMQLRWDTWSEMCEFAGVGPLADGKPEGCGVGPEGQALIGQVTDEIGLAIPVFDGIVLARQNDWIILTANGDLYPRSPAVFEAAYEPTGEEA